MICIIAALSKNRQIGLNGKMPWHIPEDLHYFREMTQGHTIIMGRKTFESIGRPLPNRRNIILTRNKEFSADGVEVIHNIKDALQLCHQLSTVFIIGGGEIYNAFMRYCDRLYLTLINQDFIGDTPFPPYHTDFKCISQTPWRVSSNHHCAYSFTVWERS